jgi:hypothetical protein
MLLGCEYQVFDDEKNAKSRPRPKGSAGALYDLYEPNEAKQLKPAGEFNTARIVVQGDRIEHWLNGQLIVSATVGDDQWNRAVAESKFSDVKDFARNRDGRIMLTDHGSEVWYRNIQFRPLPSVKPSSAATSCDEVRKIRMNRFLLKRPRFLESPKWLACPRNVQGPGQGLFQVARGRGVFLAQSFVAEPADFQSISNEYGEAENQHGQSQVCPA